MNDGAVRVGVLVVLTVALWGVFTTVDYNMQPHKLSFTSSEDAPSVPRASSSGRPDGLLFVSSSKPEWFWDIFQMNLDGSARTNLTQSEAWEYDPVWSPDRHQIAFAALADPKEKRTDIWVMNADGSQRRQITRNNIDVLAAAPTWSPDGKRIAFFTTRRHPGGAELLMPEIKVMRADGSNVRQLGEGLAPVWSPDGERILFVDMDLRLVVMGADGGDPKPLTSPLMTGSISAAWSPDGRRIAYVDRAGGQDDVFVINADGSDRRQVTQTSETEMGIQWTVDGKHLLFTQYVPGPFIIADKSNVFVSDVDGKNARKIVDEAWTGAGDYGCAAIQVVIALRLGPPPKTGR